MCSNNLLTIAIPTYNGGKVIGQALDSVLEDIGSLNKGMVVNILVLDNASSDNTMKIVEGFQNKYPDIIRYERNHENIGYDRNINRLFQLSGSSQYVKILADDDALMPGAIGVFLELLNTYPEVDCFQSNFSSYDKDLIKRTCEMSVNNGEDAYCVEGSKFLGEGEGRYGQVSSLMIKRSSWLQHDVEIGIGTNYLHVYMTFKIINSGPSYIISQPLIKVREGSPNFETDSSKSFLVPMGALPIFRLLIKQGKYTKQYKRLHAEQRKYCLRKIVGSKRMGVESLGSVIKKIMDGKFDSPLFLLSCLSLLVVPAWVYDFCWRMKVSFK